MTGFLTNHLLKPSSRFQVHVDVHGRIGANHAAALRALQHAQLGKDNVLSWFSLGSNCRNEVSN